MRKCKHPQARGVAGVSPEAITAYSYTLAEFNKLISDCTRSPIRSESELRGFYREFLLVSRFLIAKGRIGTPEQLRAFSASLGPRLAIAVHNRLERIFPDHLPEDLYDSDVIYEATRCTLAWEHSVPLVEPPRPFP